MPRCSELTLIWLLIAMAGLTVFVYLLPNGEELGMIKTTCRMINLVVTQDGFNCKRDHWAVVSERGRYLKVNSKNLFNFTAVKAFVSLDYFNQTCRKAKLFRSYKDAKSMKFKHSADECEHGRWDLVDFVSSLGPNGQLTCEYNQNMPERAYYVKPWPVRELTAIVLLILLIAVVWYNSSTLLLFVKEPSMEEISDWIQTNDMKRVKTYFRGTNVNRDILLGTSFVPPLYFAALCGHVKMVEYFIRAGANVLAGNTHGISTLGIVCVKLKGEPRREIVEVLVQAGCQLHDPLFSLPLFLLQQGEKKLCELLIEAGYDLRCDGSVMADLNLPEEHRMLIQGEIESVPPLKRLCRAAIRNSLGTNITKPDLNLCLPQKLMHFLWLDRFASDSSGSGIMKNVRKVWLNVKAFLRK